MSSNNQSRKSKKMNIEGNLTGKRRPREYKDIIINKHDIYTLLNDINFDENFLISKKKASEMSSPNDLLIESDKIKKENINSVSDTGNSTENLIKREDARNPNDDSENKQNILKLLLSDIQLCQFTDIFQIFSKEIESPFTMDYFVRLKDILNNEEKDRIINALLFLVWSLKFMRIDPMYAGLKFNKVESPIIFSIAGLNERLLINESGVNKQEIKEKNVISNYMIANSPQVIYSHNKSMVNMQGFQYPGNYIIPFNLCPGIPLISSPAYGYNNSQHSNIVNNIHHNNQQTEIISSGSLIPSKIRNSSYDDSNSNSMLNNSTPHPFVKSVITFPSIKDEESDISCRIKKETDFIDITMSDDRMKDDNFEKVSTDVSKIFAKPITEETFKSLRNYLQDKHVDKIEETIKKNMTNNLNKKQYILLCKKDKEGLYLKIDPKSKKCTITRSYYKSNK